MAEDVFKALNDLDLNKFEEPLRDFLKNYNADREQAIAKSSLPVMQPAELLQADSNSQTSQNKRQKGVEE